MGRKKHQGLSRRDFVKLAGSGALALGATSAPAFLSPERAAAQQKTLKILQWSHFVPAWDTWFNNTFTKEWGQKNNTNVIVDNINLVDLSARAASEVSANWERRLPPCTSRVSRPQASCSWLLAGLFVIARAPSPGPRQATKKPPQRAALLLSRALSVGLLAHGLLAISFAWLQAGRPNHHVAETGITPTGGLASMADSF